VHPDQSRVIIPNRKIVGEILHNYGTLRQLTVRVSVDPRVDLREALAVARETVLAHPRVLRDPVPLVAIAGVSEVGIGIAVQPWVAVADYGPVEGELYHALLDRFRAQNIQLGQRELRLRQVS
jgi:small conductance mechanosensitive channel